MLENMWEITNPVFSVTALKFSKSHSFPYGETVTRGVS